MSIYDARMIREASDVDAGILSDAEEIHDGWFADEPRVDWEDFIDRLANKCGPSADPPYDFDQYDNAAIRKIQRHVREIRSQ